MKVAIYEPFAVGHRFHFVALLISALRNLDCKIELLTSKSAAQSPEFSIHLSPFVDSFDIFELPEVTSDKSNYFLSRISNAEAKRFSYALNKIKPDHLFVTTASQFTTEFASRFTYRSSFANHDLFSEGLHLSPGYGYPDLTFPRKCLNRVQSLIERKLPWNIYSHLDPFQLQTLRKQDRNPEKYLVMPDPSPTPPEIPKESVRKSFGIPEDGRYIGCSGAITREKGVIDLIQAFRDAIPKIDPNEKLLFAGKFSEDVKSYVASHCADLIRSGRLYCIDRRLSEHEMDSVIRNFDILCAAQYWRPGSSGMLIRAAAAGVPVIARDRYWSGRIVPMFGLGWTCQTWDVKHFSIAIIRCFNDLSDYQPPPTASRFVEFHSIENFKSTMLVNIRRRLELPPDPLRKEWNWVTERLD